MPPVIVAVAAAAAVGAVGVALGAATVVGALLSVAATAVAAGASYLLRPSVGRAATAGVVATASPANGQRSIPIAQPVPPRRMVFGQVRTGGVLFFQDNANPFLYVGAALSEGTIEAVDTLYFGEDAVPVDANGDSAAGSRFFGRLKFEWTQGAVGQAASTLLTGAFPATLDSTFRQRGAARAVVRLDWGADASQNRALWGNSISPSFGVRGLRVFDPRDPLQSAEDPTFWKYAANPALCVAHALRFAWGVGLRSADIDWPAVAAAADVCDAPVTVAGTPMAMFRLAGIFEAGANVGDQLEEMLSAFRGRITYQAGKYALVADMARAPVWTIADEDIVELGEFVYATEARARFNVISAIFYNGADQGTRATTKPYELLSDIAANGLRETAITLPFTPDSHSAQIIAYRELQRAQDGRALSLTVTDAGLYLAPGDVVAIATADAAFLNGQFEVIQVDLAAAGALLTLRGYGAAPYADPATYLI